MNLLFYCSEYPPYKAGGIGTVTKIIAEELVRSGHNVSVIGYYPDIQESYVNEYINGVRVIRHNLGYRNSKMKQRIYGVLWKIGLSGVIVKRELLYIENKIEEYIHNNNIDVLELTDYYPFVLCSSRLNFKKFSVPTVLRIHGSASFIQNLSGKGNKSYDSNDERHFQRCDHISAVSAYSMNYVKCNFYLPNIKSWNVIYNPIEDSFINKSEPVDNDNVLFIGKLTETKGCYSLIKAFNQCAEHNPSLHLRLAGQGDEDVIKAMINPSFIDRVLFLGYCDRERLKAEIDNCSFACIPSYFENFSMVPLEIMGRGKTLIYTERTSGKEIITNRRNGYVVDPENIELITTLMQNLISDHNLRDELADNAYQFVSSTFSMSSLLHIIETYYYKLVLDTRKTA